MALLLDTCALLWIVNGDPIADLAQEQIAGAEARSENVYLSAITAWEVAMLSAKQRIRLTKLPKAWFESAISATSLTVQPLSVDVLIQSASLPGTPPSDPADRMIIATAREHDLAIVTRDQRILGYGELGLVKVIAC